MKWKELKPETVYYRADKLARRRRVEPVRAERRARQLARQSLGRCQFVPTYEEISQHGCVVAHRYIGHRAVFNA